MKALIGKKLGMSQIFDEQGNARAVTLIEAGPCVVTQVKTRAKDGYNAIQLGFGVAKHTTKPLAGHLKAGGVNAQVLREVPLEDVVAGQANEAEAVEGAQESLELKVGQKLDAGLFNVGDKIQVIGTSKGKGFAGTVKRHNFNTGPKTHGSHNYRAPGSIGAGYPQHVMKGMKMAGRMGGDRVTVKNLKVLWVDVAQNLLGVSGAVPGPRKSVVMIRGGRG